MADNSKIVGALVLGAAVGAVLGLLFSPSKGSEIRKKIVDNAGDIMDELNDKIGDGKDVFSALKFKAMAKANELKNQAQNEFNIVKETVQSVNDPSNL